MVVVRQRPQTANGMTFVTIEDEFHLVDLVVFPRVYERYRQVFRQEILLIAYGKVERGEGGVVNVILEGVWPLGGTFQSVPQQRRY